MPVSPATIRLLLLLTLLGMELLAAVFLSRRRMTFWQYAAWGMLAVLVPVMGPFLVILLCPGRPMYNPSSARHRRRIRSMVRSVVNEARKLPSRMRIS